MTTGCRWGVYLNLGAGLALAVIAVWLFQRARGKRSWPVLILQGKRPPSSLLLNWAGDGFGAGDRRLDGTRGR